MPPLRQAHGDNKLGCKVTHNFGSDKEKGENFSTCTAENDMRSGESNATEKFLVWDFFKSRYQNFNLRDVNYINRDAVFIDYVVVYKNYDVV
ncbi:MAG: hypothetical protein J5552_02185 [Prevotella sp.]|nr:hypothetical protein [Prevotella sp.]